MPTDPISINDELRLRVTTALDEVTSAEEVLAATLGDLDAGAARAAKVTITTAVADAFGRLRRAHEELSRARELLAKE